MEEELFSEEPEDNKILKIYKLEGLISDNKDNNINNSEDKDNREDEGNSENNDNSKDNNSSY